MLIFYIEMFEGCSVEQKRKFVEEVMCVMCELLGCVLGVVDIIIIDIKCENWVIGGVLWFEQK